jgi:hypothetical protein
MTDKLSETLKERGGRYGEFKDQAIVAVALKNILRYEFSEDLLELSVRPGWARLEPYQQHALDIIMDKVARVLNGDPNYLDNWLDIAGYATLVRERLEKDGVGFY